MVRDEIQRMAGQEGFSHVGFLKTGDLRFLKEVRDMCASGRCHSYGKCWTCPPHCGTLEDSIRKAQRYQHGIVLQMTGMMADDFDWECMQETEERLKNAMFAMADQLRLKNIPFLPMTAGTCRLCAQCACPDSPCRFPDKAMISMEAYGLVVSDTCLAAGLGYNYGKQTMTFTGCILFNE